MLALLDGIEGVEDSFANESGSLVRLSLRPGAQPATVLTRVRLVLGNPALDYVPVPLDAKKAAAALRGEVWREPAPVAAPATPPAETPAPVRRVPSSLLGLILACLAVGLGLLGWRYRAVALGLLRDLRFEMASWRGNHA